MGTATQPALAVEGAESVGSSPVVWTRQILSRAASFLVPARHIALEEDAFLELSLPARVRKFVWIASGLFAAASFAMPALGIFALGSVRVEDIGTSFLSAIVSAFVFGLTSMLRFGPDEA